MQHLTQRTKNFLLIGGIALASVWLYIETYYFEEEFGSVSATYGPEFFPRILLGLILLLCLALAVGNFRDRAAAVVRDGLAKPEAMRVVGTIASCVVFALLWEWVDFLAGAFAFALCICILLRPSRISMVVIAAFIPATWYFFTRILMVQF